MSNYLFICVKLKYRRNTINTFKLNYFVGWLCLGLIISEVDVKEKIIKDIKINL